MIFKDLDRIVFAGDSVTDMGSENPVGEGLFDNVGRGYIAWDRIHPNQVGATLMAREFLKHCDFDYSRG